MYEADFHKLGLYASGRVWANAWDVFHPTSSRGGPGRRVAVDFVVCSGCGGIFCVFFLQRTRSAASMKPPCRIYLSTRIYTYTSQVPCTCYMYEPHPAHPTRPNGVLLHHAKIHKSRNVQTAKRRTDTKGKHCQGDRSVIRLTLGWVIDRSFTPVAQQVAPSHLASSRTRVRIPLRTFLFK